MRADAPALSELIFGRKQGLDCLIGHPKSYQFASKKTGARVRFERARPKYVVCRQDQRAGPTPSPLRLKEWLTRSGISDALDSGRETSVRFLGCIVSAAAHAQFRLGPLICPPGARPTKRRWTDRTSRRARPQTCANRGPRGPAAPARPNGDRMQ